MPATRIPGGRVTFHDGPTMDVALQPFRLAYTGDGIERRVHAIDYDDARRALARTLNVPVSRVVHASRCQPRRIPNG